MLQPLQIEEIVLPAGFVHLDDISDYEIFNYNIAWKLSDVRFKPLPGEKFIPKKYRYQLIQKNKAFTCTHEYPIDELCV